MRTSVGPQHRIKHYRDLEAWHIAMDFVERVYRLTREFPHDERYALSVQIRRAAVSIPSNIAEGHKRQGDNEFAHYLSVARASLAEVETQAEIAFRLSYLDEPTFREFMRHADFLGQKVGALRRSVADRR